MNSFLIKIHATVTFWSLESLGSVIMTLTTSKLPKMAVRQKRMAILTSTSVSAPNDQEDHRKCSDLFAGL